MKWFAFLLLSGVAVAVAVAVDVDVDAKDGQQKTPTTAVDVVGNIFHSCVKFGEFSCVKPKVLKFLSGSLKNDRIQITEDLSIENNGGFSSDWKRVDPEDLPTDEKERKERIRFLMLEKIDNFLNSHELKVKLPKEIVTGEVFPFVPKFLLDNVPQEVVLPLSETKNVGQERGHLKKVIIPFLLGLKIKATTFIPIAIALIALKTWKALTLGLLSLVLSAAMVIFKFAKPKVVNYEVYHYPSHHPPAPPIVDHPYDHHHGYGRSGRSQGHDLAYRAHR